jgi:thioredoxin-related protein
MHKKIHKTVLVIFLFLLSACHHDDDKSSTYEKVFKSDGSVQCDTSKIELDIMAMELINAGIDVVCSQTGHDGLTRATLCGLSTGNINIYKINSVNLSDAESIGFESVSTLSEYQDQKCE